MRDSHNACKTRIGIPLTLWTNADRNCQLYHFYIEIVPCLVKDEKNASSPQDWGFVFDANKELRQKRR